MSIYLDASVLVAFWIGGDSLNARASELLRGASGIVVLSDFAAAEFSSAVARRVRSGEIGTDQAWAGFADFDAWRSRATQRLEIVSSDVSVADAYLRRLDLNLRAPDAIHIAMADRIGATLATFDRRLGDCARNLGVAVAGA